MESPSAKRRRTSPNASVSVNASNTDSRLLSQQDVVQPSYMSPTKASIARFYPDLAPQSSEPTTPRSKGRLLLDQHSSSLKGGPRSASKIFQQPRPVSEANAAFLNNVARAAGALLVSSQGDASSQPKEPSPVGSQVSASNAWTLPVSGLVVGAGDQEPRASPPPEPAEHKIGTETGLPNDASPVADLELQSKTTAEPSQPELNDTEFETERVESAKKDAVTIGGSNIEDTVTLSTPTRRGAGAPEDHEPRLPSTPRQLGIEPPGSKPTGVLSMSPKRCGKRRRLEGTKSSPLKPRDAAPNQPKHVFEAQTVSRLGLCRPSLPFDPGVDDARSLGPSSEPFHADHLITPAITASELSKPDPLFKGQHLPSLRIAAGDETPVTENGSSPMFRDISFSSTDGVLTLKIRTFFNAGSKKVASIAVLGLNSWASSELGTWLKAPIADRTLDTIARAIDRFWDMIGTRAFCWYNCEGEFSHLVDTTAGSISTASEEMPEMHEYTQKPDMQEVVALSSARKNSVDAPGPFTSGNFPAEKLVHYAGQRSVRFKDSATSLEITWRINITPSGEVTSKVTAHASFPTSWAEEPDQGDLCRVDEAFVRLLRSGKTVYEAVRCIVEVVFPT